MVQASTTGFIDEYGDQQQTYYEGSSSDPMGTLYQNEAYTSDDYQSSRATLTEDMLLRYTSTNGGKFPTHLLTKLGSQVYDMPSDQVDLSNVGRRTTTTTTTRYYTVNQTDPSYDSAVEEVMATAPRYAEERYVQMRTSDANNLLGNYEVYSETGERLEGEQVNY